MTGVAESVPSVSFVGSTVAPAAIASVPSETVVCSVREEPSVSVPAPVFASKPAVGAEMVAEISGTDETTGTVSVAVPSTVALAANSIFAGEASAASVASAFAVLKMALLPSAHVAAAPPFVQASASPQFVCVPFQV